jgi:diaminohydroxyphosphoribosylaminopyrimidine deaminase/5-amino-6-(5-phosphoribosylamino)uracil reductase
MSGATAADRRWLTAAVELSRLCSPTSTNYAVGAIIVDRDGAAIATGHTGETGSRQHAEEVAIGKLAGRAGLDLRGATIYTSLEPCTTRKSRPGTCTDLILAAGLQRVVLALREPLIFADCNGVEALTRRGLEVIEISDLADLVRGVNAHVMAPARPRR